MMIDRKFFFDALRPYFPGRKLDARQVAGMETKLQVWEKFHAAEPLDFLANCLAQCSWETGWQMIPRKEADYVGKSAQRAYLMKNYDVTGSNPSRARANGNTRVGDGFTFAGAGDIQLTWANNYIRMGSLLGVDLYKNPQLAMDPVISARIMFTGMVNGFFTGKSLRQYFNSSTYDPKGARAIVNGDKSYTNKTSTAKIAPTVGDEIKRRHEIFKKALRKVSVPLAIAETVVAPEPIVTTPVTNSPVVSTHDRPVVMETGPITRPVETVQPSPWEVFITWLRGV